MYGIDDGTGSEFTTWTRYDPPCWAPVATTVTVSLLVPVLSEMPATVPAASWDDAIGMSWTATGWSTPAPCCSVACVSGVGDDAIGLDAIGDEAIGDDRSGCAAGA